MPKFSAKSKQNLSTIHPDLQLILNEAIHHIDFTILEGLRSPERQQELLTQGKTTTLNSKHLEQPSGYSHAVDIAPYPIDWNDRERFCFLAGFILAIASQNNICLRWGGDWDGDLNLSEHKFSDLPHFELKKP